MAELIWTEKAVTSLEDIYDYINETSVRFFEIPKWNIKDLGPW